MTKHYDRFTGVPVNDISKIHQHIRTRDLAIAVHLRKERGYFHYQIAQELSINPSAVSKALGRRSPDKNLAKRSVQEGLSIVQKRHPNTMKAILLSDPKYTEEIKLEIYLAYDRNQEALKGSR